MRIAIYSRKSISTGKGESIENQIEMCKQYIYSKFPDIDQKDINIYEDEGFSAKNLERPQFKQMLSKIEHRQLDCIICYKLDRVSRNISDFSSLIETLNNNGIAFICIKEEFDTSKPMGKAMMYIASVFAQLERETIAERVRDNMMMLARTGRWLGGTTPTGFTSEKCQSIIIDGKIKTSCTLKFNDDEIAVVKTIFEKFLELGTISGVSKYLIQENIKSRTNKFYSLLGIKEILSNPVYCIADKASRDYFSSYHSDVCFEESECSDIFGLISYNKRDYRKKNVPRNSKDEWIIAIGKHNGIVSGKQWVTVQNTLHQNTLSHNASKVYNNYSLLSGMIICQKCGQRMFTKARCSNKNLFDYVCNSKMRGGSKLCDCQNLNGLQTDDTVCEYLTQYTNPNSDIYILLENLKKQFQSNKNPNYSSLKSVTEQIEKLNSEITNLVDRLSDPTLNKMVLKHINQRIVQLDNQLEELNINKLNLEATSNSLFQSQAELDMIASSLSNFKQNFAQITVQEQRSLLRLLIDKIEWDGESLHIFICGKQQIIS